MGLSSKKGALFQAEATSTDKNGLEFQQCMRTQQSVPLRGLISEKTCMDWGRHYECRIAATQPQKGFPTRFNETFVQVSVHKRHVRALPIR